MLVTKKLFVNLYNVYIYKRNEAKQSYRSKHYIHAIYDANYREAIIQIFAMSLKSKSTLAEYFL